jgi:hypothetical protein
VLVPAISVYRYRTRAKPGFQGSSKIMGCPDAWSRPRRQEPDAPDPGKNPRRPATAYDKLSDNAFAIPAKR